MRTLGIFATPLSACAGVALLLAACATTPPGGAATGQDFVVKVPQTPIFRYGPAQSFGADFNLKQGDRVTMLKREYGYSRVMAPTGQSGFVATEDLEPAPPLPAPTPTPTPKQTSTKRHSFDLSTGVRRPPQPGDPEPLGLPEPDSGEVPPAFRY